MESPLVIKSAAFADRILDMSDFLLTPKVEWQEVTSNGKTFRKKVEIKPKYSVEVCVKQGTRSGTSIGANVAEGINAQSKEDLISKYSIALKESDETRYWLDRLLHRNAITDEMHSSMLNDLNEIVRMLAASIKTLKENLRKRREGIEDRGKRKEESD